MTYIHFKGLFFLHRWVRTLDEFLLRLLLAKPTELISAGGGAASVPIGLNPEKARFYGGL